MPNIKSAKKRVKLNKKQNERNSAYKSSLKTALKKFMVAVETKADNMDVLYKDACVMIDKATSKNIFHKNTAARRKSKLTKIFQAANA